ncbi:MAG TPA: glycogen debranching protein GlgX [Allosphingosinicella sp.]|jgi:glycogen operon protein
MIYKLSEGAPDPLGVTPDARGVNVAIFSANATAIEFCLFDEADREVARIRLPERTGDVFHGHVAGVAPGAHYGLRAHGAFAPEEGHRFNAAKLLVDTHARLLDRPFKLHGAMFGYPQGGDDLGFDPTDSAPFMPKAVVLAASGARAGHVPLKPWRETILYELHVRGFTKQHPGVPEAVRGTFGGLSSPAAIEHLVKLGVTSVEIMPCAAWIEERHLQKLGLSNYWGYNPAALMAPEPRLAPGGWDEIRGTVAALAEAGIETIVDVVLNHSGEGDALGPTLSLRGLDNASYYRLLPEAPRRYIDDAGCGNTLALDRAPVVRLAMDALRTWVREAGVHGFRFDLGATMGRRPDGFDPEAPLIAALQQDPELSGLKLISEPWDIGPGGYQLGRFPAGWGEWNDRFRDDVRRFWKGEPHRLGALATRLAGSADVFGIHRPASRSVNFVTAHDGFALADLVAHERKRNEANGEDNRDGSDGNHSWNNGCEGESDDPAVSAARHRDQRALIATLLFARGTPMLSMGAELGHSQQGNNNCYAQDNSLSWLSWEGLDEALLDFTRRAAALRRAIPLLQADARLEGEPGADGLPDVEWLSPEGWPMAPGDWDAPDAGSVLMLLGGGGERVGVLLHRAREGRSFRLPKARHGRRWAVLLDSGSDAEEYAVEGEAVEVAARSVLLVAEREVPGGASGVSSETLERLATAAGVQGDWWTVEGERHEVSEDTKRHLLGAMRLPAGSEREARESLARLAEAGDLRPLPFAHVLRAGEAGALPLAFEPGLRQPVWLSITGEDGAVARVLADASASQGATAVDGRRFGQRRVALPPLAAGHYEVRREDRPDCACRLTVSPGQAYLPESIRRGHKLFGVAAQLYALRRAGDQGIGDFTTLAELAARSAQAGAAAVGINPLHAMFPEQRERASPYQPSDRRFLEPIYLDLAALGDLPGGEAVGDDRIAGLREARLVDYPGVWAVKEAALRRLFDGFEAQASGLTAELEAFAARGGTALETYATFCLLSRTQEGPWQGWASELRDPASAAVRGFAEAHRREVRFQIFLQWLCERQLSAAAGAARDWGMEIGLYRDLAVGGAPDGAEAWAQQGLLASGVSIGAPPDPFGPDGQVWCLPPPDPHAMRADGYRAFGALLEANMAHAGALRIDHAMGLSRLFWVPDGAEGRDGAYVSYPLEQLLGEVALASQRARTMVIGEDLGTVPEGFREALAGADVLGYRVMLLEREGKAFRSPAHFPPLSLSCVTSHDLPTLAGWQAGAEIAERAEIGLVAADAAAEAMAEREAEKAALAGLVGGGEDLAVGVHARLAEGPSLLVMAQADDLGGEESSINLPGTDTERPNWRRKVRVPVEDLFSGEGGAILGAIAAVRGKA